MTAVTSATVGESRSTALDLLGRAREIVGPELNSVARQLSAELRAAVSHHLSGGGKYLRAALVLAGAEAAGCDEKTGLPGAVAVELVHNFSLVHDDIIDGDLERRHRTTVWAEYGVGPAIILGDALVTLAFQVLLKDPTVGRVAAALRLAESTQDMIGGQAEDMAGEQRPALTVAECLKMAEGKTGALLSCAACLGATLAAAPLADVEALADFGRHLGIAFQAVDDVLGIWGEPSVTGKPVGNDLRMRKKTLPVALGLAQAGVAEDLARLLGGQDIDDVAVERAARLLDACGARLGTLAIAESHLQAALGALNRAQFAERSVRQFQSIAFYVTERDK
ncbi:MAG: polyprenyl synthetase family protein [Acidimicrobiales bacterium]